MTPGTQGAPGTPGTPATIGPYQIIRELGRGGMGVVHLARDTRLDREVAIKGMPEALVADADRLARFQREAKVLASLNHPNIGGIHGLEESNGRQYLVLEYIEGETLAERLVRGPIPLDEALAIAKQIAEALEAAHDKGVVHRDLKPGNVMVTPEGVAKVLDFGLSRTGEAFPSSTSNPASLADSPTITTPAARAPRNQPVHSPTIPGVIMGSAGYMSPEQARGKPVDKRSDIFSFGCVLYEMLTGDMPFRGETAADAIGATLHKEIDFSRLPVATPRRVRELVSNCLARDLKSRLHDIGDARLELERAISEPRGHVSESAEGGAWWRSVRALAALFLVGVIALAVAVIVAIQYGRSGEADATARRVVRFSVKPPEGFTLPIFMDNGSGIAAGPSGDRIVFEVRAAGRSSLAVRDLADGTSRLLPNTEDCFNPFFSPDGKWLGFMSKGRLMKMPAEGGPSLTICELSNFAAFAWHDDGTIVFGTGPTGLWRVSAQGGQPVQVAKAGPDAKVAEPGLAVLGLDVPVAVPGANYVLSTGWDGFTTEDYHLYAVSLADGTVRRLLRAAADARLIAPDRLLFMRGTTVMTVGFDAASGSIVGEPTVALEKVRTDQWMDTAFIGASVSGTFAYVPGGRFGADRRIVKVDESGKVTPLLDTADNYNRNPVVSPDGKKAIVTTLRNRVEMWVLDLERRTMSLVNAEGEVFAPVWSADGASILAARNDADGASKIVKWSVGAGGGDPQVLPGTSGPFMNPQQELADGSGLLLQTSVLGVERKPDLAVYRYGDAKMSPVRNSPAAEGSANISPDGKWLAYGSDESGRYEVYLGPLGASGPNVQVSASGGGLPKFSRDGKRLYFLDEKGTLLSAVVEVRNAEPLVSIPSKVVDLKALNLRAVLGFDFLSDGSLLMLEKAAWESEPPEFHVILNWDEELRRSRPVGGQR